MSGSRYGDFSRFLFDPEKHYSAVLMQQGRVQLDSDWNALVDLFVDRMRAEMRDLVGPSGGPTGNAGFAILPGYALLFDGQDDLATISGGVQLFAPPEGLTLELWVHPRSRPGALISRICRNPGATVFHEDLALEILADGRVRVHRAELAVPDLESDMALSLDSPVQVAVSSSAAGTRLYLNGHPAASDGHGVPPRPGAETVLLLGASLVDGRPADLFHGLFDELRIWGKARGEDEIRATLHQGPGRGEPALLGHWRFDAGRGMTVEDRTGHGNPCILGGGREENRPSWILRNLRIGPGRYYVDGIACANERATSFEQQPDLPGAVLPDVSVPGLYLFYLDVWERSITSIEDPALLEAALGGPDTTTRSQVIAQVKCLALGAGAPPPEAGDPSPWAELLARDGRRGRLRARRQGSVTTLGNLLYRVEIHQGGAPLAWPRPAAALAAAAGVAGFPARSQVQLATSASLPPPGAWVELFSPVTDARGAPGLLARVTAVDDGSRTLTLDPAPSNLAADSGVRIRGVAACKWSQDNAAPAWPIDRLEAGNPLVQLANVGRDDLDLQAGSWVEIADDLSVLQGRVQGLYRVERVDTAQRRVTLAAAPAAGCGQAPQLHPLLRRWDQTAQGTVGGSVPIRDGWLALEAGIDVAFDGDGEYRAGDFWRFPARALSEDIEWPGGPHGPEARSPDGVGHGYAPLAFLNVDGDGLRCTDCRKTFEPLTIGAVSKAGDTVYGSLEVRGDLTTGGAVRAGAFYGTLAAAGCVETGALADGAVTAAKLASGIGTVPEGAAILSESPAAPQGYRATGFSMTLVHPVPRWTVRREIPRSNEGALASAVVEGRIFTLLETGELWVYDPASNGWWPRRPLPEARSAFALAAAAGKLFAFGGLDARGERDGAVLEYDPAADQWSSRSPLPTPRSALAAAVFGGSVYTFGGLRGGSSRGKVSNANERYDPDSDAWTAGRPLPAPRYNLGAAALNDRIHILGGEGKPFLGRFGRMTSADHRCYHPAANRWEKARAPLPSPRALPGIAVAAGRLYAIGGRSLFGDTADVDEYAPATDSWTARAPLPQPIAAPGTAAVGGTLYVIGVKPSPEARAVLVLECPVAAEWWIHRREG